MFFNGFMRSLAFCCVLCCWNKVHYKEGLTMLLPPLYNLSSRLLWESRHMSCMFCSAVAHHRSKQPADCAVRTIKEQKLPYTISHRSHSRRKKPHASKKQSKKWKHNAFSYGFKAFGIQWIIYERTSAELSLFFHNNDKIFSMSRVTKRGALAWWANNLFLSSFPPNPAGILFARSSPSPPSFLSSFLKSSFSPGRLSRNSLSLRSLK